MLSKANNEFSTQDDEYEETKFEALPKRFSAKSNRPKMPCEDLSKENLARIDQYIEKSHKNEHAKLYIMSFGGITCLLFILIMMIGNQNSNNQDLDLKITKTECVYQLGEIIKNLNKSLDFTSLVFFFFLIFILINNILMMIKLKSFLEKRLKKNELIIKYYLLKNVVGEKKNARESRISVIQEKKAKKNSLHNKILS
ncbi:hypothetical protein BpHYR1_049543 [Brachionus plicatilis]|uniref:Uncharacterized protein n=1 Tax=Brachionus plicatilis TaxID=10195 RepID=A0A3M7SB43_BRAPC|nr:hypothetical protein BpHYR1_049543 [Brachionus plicatilis]